MKITVRQLKQLIREAAYEGPGTASLTTVPDSLSSTKVSNRRESHISKLRLEPESRRLDSELYIYFAENPSPRFGARFEPGSHVHIVDKGELADVLLTLGFSKTAISRSVNFSLQHPLLDGGIAIPVSKVFVREWKDLIGTLAIDL